MIRVLIVEDLLVVRQFLEHVLSSDPAIEVVGSARSGEEAIELVRLTRPQVITMDINMPGMDGLEATRRIMETLPTPIVVVSASWDAAEVGKTFQAMEAGAVAVLAKPGGDGRASSVEAARDLIQTVKLMSEVKVVRRWTRAGAVATRPSEADLPGRTGEIEVVAIGASTGGPVPIQTILRGIPRPIRAAVLIVQHMAAGFTRGFAEWLSQSTGLTVQIGAQGERMLAGHVYVAPEDRHMGVSGDGGLELSGAPPENGMRPSASHLLRSVARVHGGRAVGVLLSGMGTDGAEGLGLMRERGAVTFAQDEQSCAVWGMPGEAVKLHAAVYQLPPERIAEVLADLLRAADHRGMSRP